MAIYTTNLTAFLPLVQPHLPGAAIPTMTQALRKSAIDFCERTRCWREKLTATVTRQDYSLFSPGYATIHEFEKATFDGDTTLTPIEFADLDLDEFDETGQPSVITQSSPNTVSILPFKEGVLTLSVFLKPQHGLDYVTDTNNMPAIDFDSVPEFLLSRYGEIIAAGAIARVMMLPQQPFTNPKLANVHAAQFSDGVSRFNAANVRGQHRARPRVRASWF